MRPSLTIAAALVLATAAAPAFAGATWNGQSWNGSAWNGASWNGPTWNGQSQNGGAVRLMESVAIVAVTLPSTQPPK